MPARNQEVTKRRRKVPAHGTEEYYDRRERNNIAVKKSRQKSRTKAKGMLVRVEKLRSENEKLEKQVEILSKELSVLRDIFRAANAGSHIGALCDLEDNSDQHSVDISDDDSMVSEDSLASEEDMVDFNNVDLTGYASEDSIQDYHIVAMDHKYSVPIVSI